MDNSHHCCIDKVYPVLKQNYLDIDPIIDKWVADNSLSLHKEYKEVEVRSVDIFDKLGNRRFQIWIDPIKKDGSIVVQIWEIKKTIKERRAPSTVELVATIATFRETLDQALDQTR